MKLRPSAYRESDNKVSDQETQALFYCRHILDFLQHPLLAIRIHIYGTLYHS